MVIFLSEMLIILVVPKYGCWSWQVLHIYHMNKYIENMFDQTELRS